MVGGAAAVVGGWLGPARVHTGGPAGRVAHAGGWGATFLPRAPGRWCGPKQVLTLLRIAMSSACSPAGSSAGRSQSTVFLSGRALQAFMPPCEFRQLAKVGSLTIKCCTS